MTREASCGHRTENARSPFGRLRIFTATFPTVAHGSPLGDRTVSHVAPADEEKWGGIRRTLGKFELRVKFAGASPDECRMGALSADHHRIFAGFEPRMAVR